MRIVLLSALTLALAACSDTSAPGDMSTSVDMAVNMDLSHVAVGDAGGASLVVNNTLDWCTVTVTVGSGTPTTFTSASMTFNAAAGTTVTIKADPLATFMPVKWTGVTTMSGDTATYVMTSAASQSVTACCAESNGTGC
jgi:hypothetical protein